MRRIRSDGSRAEKMLRRALWHAGFRYRKNVKRLPGRPDLAFFRLKIAVFIDGDFWHGRNWAERKLDFKTNRKYWLPKIERNIERDAEVNFLLEKIGWRVVRIWESEVKRDFGAVFRQLTRLLTDAAGGSFLF